MLNIFLNCLLIKKLLIIFLLKLKLIFYYKEIMIFMESYRNRININKKQNVSTHKINVTNNSALLKSIVQIHREIGNNLNYRKMDVEVF